MKIFIAYDIQTYNSQRIAKNYKLFPQKPWNLRALLCNVIIITSIQESIIYVIVKLY